MTKKFNYLRVPETWQQYWTRYPQGYTIMEALIDWVSQLNEMADNINDWNEYLDEFVATWDKNLQTQVINLLSEWQEDGTLDIIIDEALQTQMDVLEEETHQKLTEFREELTEFEGELEKTVRQLDIDKTVTVGPTGDYTTINKAIEELSKERLNYRPAGYTVEILLQSGFIMGEQILVRGLDLGWIVISSEDPEVTVNREMLTMLFGDENKYPLFGGSDHATLPIINTQFVMDNSGIGASRDGLYLEKQSSAYVTPGSGVRNAGGYGIRAFDGCRVLARDADFSHAGERGCMISQGTSLYAPGINLSYAKGRNTFRAYRNATANIEGANLSHGAEVNVRISEGSQVDMQYADVSNAGLVNSEGNGHGAFVYGSSTVYAVGANFDNCAGPGLQVSNGAIVSANDASIKNAGSYGINAYGNAVVYAVSSIVTGAGTIAIRASSGARVDASSTDVRGAGESGMRAEFGGYINVSNAIASGNPVGLQAREGGLITGTGAIADNCGIGVHVYWEGEMRLRGVSARNCTNKGAEVSTGSRLSATQANFTGATNYGVHVYRGSEAMIFGTQCRKGAVDHHTDITCTTGSIIRANATSGGMNLEPNTINSDGIIFY